MIISPDASGRVDAVVSNIFKDVTTIVPIVPITRLDHFRFNEELYSLDQFILADFVEYGWNWDMQTTHLFGTNTYYFKEHFDGIEWEKFDDFISKKPPILYLKRELLSSNISDVIKPIQYPSLHECYSIQSKEEFNKRLLEVNFVWGLSHERRKNVHADIWSNAGRYGYVVCDNISFLDEFLKNENNPKKWLTQNTPWYCRYPMETILGVTGNSKISLSLSGAGRCCFRHTEASLNSVMMMWNDEIEWSYPWVHNENCIRSEEGNEIETIVEALNNPDLYDIYQSGVENCRKYYLPDYQRNYIEKLINEYV